MSKAKPTPLSWARWWLNVVVLGNTLQAVVRWCKKVVTALSGRLSHLVYASNASGIKTIYQITYPIPAKIERCSAWCTFAYEIVVFENTAILRLPSGKGTDP